MGGNEWYVYVFSDSNRAIYMIPSDDGSMTYAELMGSNLIEFLQSCYTYRYSD